MLISLNTRRLHYDLIGPETGRVVCFAHALAADSGMWSEQIPAVLALGRRVLRIDMRGHGGSDPVPGDYTLAELASDIVAVLDAADIGGADYVGLSIGGMIGEALALHHSSRVSSLMLCETPPASLRNAQEIWGPRIAAVKKAVSLEPIADATMERWLTPDFKARHPVRWRQIRDTVAATSVPGYCGAVAALSSFDFGAELPRLRVPALVLYGEEDRATSHEENQRLASLIPGGRFVAVSGARHLPNIEDPARFNRILTDWLSRV
ncbi:MAG TPA: alpha/beta fold hydrolase [Micropepsaceae bacterium]|jgi:3-oxoadipate enol-lactonase